MDKIEKLVDSPFSLVIIRGCQAHHTVTFSDFVEYGEVGKLRANRVSVRFYTLAPVVGFVGDKQVLGPQGESDIMTISGPVRFVNDVIESLGIVP